MGAICRDGDRGRKAVSAALNSFVTSLGESVADEATWTEAYINTYVSFNPAWLDGTWGSTARTSDNYDTAIVTNAKGEILFGESRGGAKTGNIADHFSGTRALLDGLTRQIEKIGADAHISGYAKNSRGVAGLAAAVIHSTTGRVTTPGEDRRILWFAASALLCGSINAVVVSALSVGSDGWGGLIAAIAIGVAAIFVASAVAATLIVELVILRQRRSGAAPATAPTAAP